MTECEKETVFINGNGISCIPCRCKRQSYHKETKTTKEHNVITTHVIEDRRKMTFGGRNEVHETDIEASKKDIESLEFELTDLKNTNK